MKLKQMFAGLGIFVASISGMGKATAAENDAENTQGGPKTTQTIEQDQTKESPSSVTFDARAAASYNNFRPDALVRKQAKPGMTELAGTAESGAIVGFAAHTKSSTTGFSGGAGAGAILDDDGATGAVVSGDVSIGNDVIPGLEEGHVGLTGVIGNAPLFTGTLYTRTSTFASVMSADVTGQVSTGNANFVSGSLMAEGGVLGARLRATTILGGGGFASQLQAGAAVYANLGSVNIELGYNHTPHGTGDRMRALHDGAALAVEAELGQDWNISGAVIVDPTSKDIFRKGGLSVAYNNSGPGFYASLGANVEKQPNVRAPTTDGVEAPGGNGGINFNINGSGGYRW